VHHTSYPHMLCGYEMLCYHASKAPIATHAQTPAIIINALAVVNVIQKSLIIHSPSYRLIYARVWTYNAHMGILCMMYDAQLFDFRLYTRQVLMCYPVISAVRFRLLRVQMKCRADSICRSICVSTYPAECFRIVG
jgi:hypothetical protein